MKIGICETILALNPTAQVSCSDNDVNRIEWLENTPVIANNIILAKQIELQNAEDNRIEQEIANKQSALNKLKALGLNDAEIKSILGN
jgi:hypothetical protein